MKNGINIGPEEKATARAGEIILKILASENDQATIQKALDVFASVTQVSGTTISHYNVTDTGGE